MSDQVRTINLHSWATNKFKRTILAFVDEAQSPQTHNAIHNLLDQGKFERVNQLIENAITRLGNILPQLFIDIANEEVSYLRDKLGEKAHITPTLAKAEPTVSFDSTNERASALMRSSRLDFIQNFTADQTANTRQILANGLSQGQGVRQTARQLVDSIGLTPYQLSAVDNYRTLLEQGSADALTRQLRDRRFDGTVQGVIDTGNSLTSDQIDRMVDRYREQMLNYRAETIARTESLSILSLARQEAMQQVLDSAGMSGDDVSKTWNATPGNRTRHSHQDMDGQTVQGIDTPFETPSGEQLMYPGDPSASAAERINCRCTVTYGF